MSDQAQTTQYEGMGGDEILVNVKRGMPMPETMHHSYPQQQSQEAHERLAYIQETIDQMDGMHDEYQKAYQTRRDELMVMRAMCESAIGSFDAMVGPQHAVPSSSRQPIMDAPGPIGPHPPKLR